MRRSMLLRLGHLVSPVLGFRHISGGTKVFMVYTTRLHTLLRLSSVVVAGCELFYSSYNTSFKLQLPLSLRRS
jgi:hypothetical protein